VNAVLALSINKPSILSLSDSNSMRVALDCDVWMPRKNKSIVAQCVIDSLYVRLCTTLGYMSLTVYNATTLASKVSTV